MDVSCLTNGGDNRLGPTREGKVFDPSRKAGCYKSLAKKNPEAKGWLRDIVFPGLGVPGTVAYSYGRIMSSSAPFPDA